MNWKKALKCKHKNVYPNYSYPLNCACGGTEWHCKDCGVFFADCRCGEMAGMSGRSGKHWRTLQRNEKLRRAKSSHNRQSTPLTKGQKLELAFSPYL